MASVEKRNGRWRVRYRIPSGAQRSATFDRKIDADRFMAEVETDKARGTFVDLNLGRVTLGEWCDKWTATTVNLRPSTRARDDSYLRTHILPTFGDRSLSSIEHMEIQAWVAELSGRRAPATVRKAAQILGKLLRAAVVARIVPNNPYLGVQLPKVDREEMRFLTPGEVAALADEIDVRYRALVLVAAYCGLRIGELAGLKRSRVDLLRGRIDVVETAVEVRGNVHWGAPKSRAGRRTISLPRPVLDELSDHVVKYAGDELVFPAAHGGVLRTPNWRRRVWVPAIESAGMSPLRPHDLRHTAVALWISNGANVLEVARRAGHTSTAFTLDRYGHLYEDADQALSDRLADTFVAGRRQPGAIVPLNP